jgi:hypothetical protein
MLSLWRVAVVALCIGLYGALPTLASEAVGEAVVIKTEVRGEGGPLQVKDPVHRDEAIKTSKDGLGQFLFRDGTKLAVGWGSTVVIDKFVFDDSKTVKKLTIKVAEGTFRWISGNSKSTAYSIVTPAGTIGVRGTAFDVNINRNGTTAVVLLSGMVNFCGADGCKVLKHRCDFVVAKRNGAMTDTARVNRGVLKTLGNQRALPFLSGGQRLSGGLGGVGAGCSFAQVTDGPANNSTSPRASPARASPQAAPARASVSAPAAPSAPAAASAPARQVSAPPSDPATPGAPSTPGDPGNSGCDHHGNSHGRGGHDGGNHSGGGRGSGHSRN